MIYFDTSYILKCYLNEPQAEKVRDLAERDADKRYARPFRTCPRPFISAPVTRCI